MANRKQTGKLALCPEVGIRSLKDLTKDELIYCINAACTDEYRLHWALQEITDKRKAAKRRKGKAALTQHSELRKELEALFLPYRGMELPHDVQLKSNAIIGGNAIKGGIPMPDMFTRPGAPTAEQLIAALVSLLEDQEGVKIEYTIVDKHDGNDDNKGAG